MAELGTGVPAVVEGPVQPPLHNEGEPTNLVIREDPVPRGEEAHRYHLKAPVFTGREDVEQFIQEISDVAAVTQWPPHVALIQLRLALTDKAKPYGLGPDVDGIFATLRARFGISTIDARVTVRRTHLLTGACHNG